MISLRRTDRVRHGGDRRQAGMVSSRRWKDEVGMPRKLAKSTLARLKRELDREHERLRAIIEEFDRQRVLRRLTETASEQNAASDNADGGSVAFDVEMDLSIEGNAKDLLTRVAKALERMESGTYGICEVSGESISVARLDALPYATTLVEFADRV
jgi:RNA polymerase-binding transcription factor DksA